MNQQIELVSHTEKFTAETISVTGRLKVCLLIIFGTFLLCAAAVVYSVLETEQRKGMEINRTTLLIVFVLSAYFITDFVKGYLDARAERRNIIKMIAKLTEAELAAPNPGINGPHTEEADALIRKIIQMINA
jgi:hypothetical protein